MHISAHKHNDYTVYCMQVSQVSVWLGNQSGSGILKGRIKLAPETR